MTIKDIQRESDTRVARTEKELWDAIEAAGRRIKELQRQRGFKPNEVIHEL